MLITGSHPLAIGMANGLSARGDDVRVVAAEPASGWPIDRTIACGFASETEVQRALHEGVAQLGGLDQLVHAWVAPGLLVERPFDEVATDEWITACEGSLEGAWWLMRHLREPLVSSGGGTVVFVVPSIALAGAAGFSMLATVAEGLRVLAKGCGRQWAKNAITVNTVATAPHHWVSDDAGAVLTRAISLSTPAFGTQGEVAADLAPLVAALAGTDMHFLTAGTLVADGGLWMGL